MKYPTLAEVEVASHEQLARWYRHLPVADGPEQGKIMRRIVERFNQLGGMTAEASKKVGW